MNNPFGRLITSLYFHTFLTGVVVGAGSMVLSQKNPDAKFVLVALGTLVFAFAFTGLGAVIGRLFMIQGAQIGLDVISTDAASDVRKTEATGRVLVEALRVARAEARPKVEIAGTLTPSQTQSAQLVEHLRQQQAEPNFAIPSVKPFEAEE